MAKTQSVPLAKPRATALHSRPHHFRITRRAPLGQQIAGSHHIVIGALRKPSTHRPRYPFSLSATEYAKRILGRDIVPTVTRVLDQV